VSEDEFRRFLKLGLNFAKFVSFRSAGCLCNVIPTGGNVISSVGPIGDITVIVQRVSRKHILIV
jgi:hypothetical protein